MSTFISFGLVYVYFVLLSGSHGQVLHSVSGEVSGGNYSYYSLMYKGSITLYLFSKRGDSDLYISQYLTKPSFEPENYCLQSSTCGLDIIDIPKSFNRPVGIAVYGHPSHDFSEYQLEVVHSLNKDTFVFEEEENYFEDEEINKGKEEEEEERFNSSENESEEEEGGSFISALFWTFLNILVEVLFL